MLNEFDIALNFASLRAQYELHEFEDPDFADTMSNYINDPYLPIILNEFHELFIGDEYYNFSNPGIVIKSSNPTNNIIENIRNYGLAFTDISLTYYDLKGDKIEGITNEERDIRLLAYFSKEISDDNGLEVEMGIFVSSFFITINNGPNEQLYQCKDYKFEVDWGDDTGIQTVYSGGNIWYANPKVKHYYEKSNAPAGQCETYNIKIKAIKINGDCYTLWPDIFALDGQTFYYNNLNVQICNFQCFAGKHQSELSHEFFYEGKQYRVRGEVVQNTRPTFSWIQPKIFGRITFYKKRNNGRFKKSKPPVSMNAQILGRIYDLNCTNGADFDNARTEFHRRQFKVKYKPGYYFSTSKQSPNPVFGNFNVILGYNSSGQEISETLGNVKLWQ